MMEKGILSFGQVGRICTDNFEGLLPLVVNLAGRSIKHLWLWLILLLFIFHLYFKN